MRFEMIAWVASGAFPSVSFAIGLLEPELRKIDRRGFILW
jgi:hypothetical protein